jgi:protein gp37
MADGTLIEWTDASWQITTGCSVLSPGCTNCYAMRLAGTRMKHHASRVGLTIDSKAGPVWNGEVRFNEAWLDQPLRWKRSRRIFVAAHGDLFHEAIPDAWIDRVFAVMALSPQHTFQVLTKRAERMRDYVSNMGPGRRVERFISAQFDISRSRYCWDGKWPLPNVWLGVSVEDQQRADERIPLLLDTPAAVRFISAEPMLGPVDLRRWVAIDWRCSYCREIFTGPHKSHCPSCGREGGWTGSHRFNGRHYPRGPIAPSQRGSGLDWVIVGGESGPGARPMHPSWARKIRDDCQAAGVAYFHKQNGEYRAVDTDVLSQDGHPVIAYAHGDYIRVGKAKAGRLLDGREWSEFPA